MHHCTKRNVLECSSAGWLDLRHVRQVPRFDFCTSEFTSHRIDRAAMFTAAECASIERPSYDILVEGQNRNFHAMEDFKIKLDGSHNFSSVKTNLESSLRI